MASELHVDAIKHSGGTSALTIDSSGNVHKAGMVVQTVDFTHGTTVASNSTSFVNTGLVGTITPKFSNSKIYISVFQQYRISGVHDHGIGFKITRTIGGAVTTVYTPATSYEVYFYDGTANSTSHEEHGRFPIFAVDSPNSTSACAYNVQFASMRTDNSNSAKAQDSSNKSHGYLMEIAQ
tara:strand:- start:24 stop:563 length:540 start_codon:yes stop_codon:yes gene_type:complete